MSKEIDDCIKQIKPNAANFDYCKQNNLINGTLYGDIKKAMQSYAKEQVDKALKEKGKELLNFQEEIISNPIRFNGVNHKVIEKLMNIEPEF